MRQAFQDVTDFHVLGGVSCGPGQPVVPDSGDDREAHVLDDLSRQLKLAAQQLKGSRSTAALRVRLMAEELGEIIEAIADEDVTAYADGLADLVYVTVGSAVQCGIPLPEVWQEVQRANMSKFPTCEDCQGCGKRLRALDLEPIECDSCKGLGRVVLRDAGGKVMKPPGWTPPDIAGVLARAPQPDDRP